MIARLIGVNLTKSWNDNSVAIWWDVSNENWQPSHVRIQFCRSVDFKPSASHVPPSQMKACTNFTTSSADAEMLAYTTFFSAQQTTPSPEIVNATTSTSTPRTTLSTLSVTTSTTTGTTATTRVSTTSPVVAAALTSSQIPAAFLMIARNLEDFVQFDVKVHGMVRGLVTAGPVTTLQVTTGG